MFSSNRNHSIDSQSKSIDWFLYNVRVDGQWLMVKSYPADKYMCKVINENTSGSL